MNSEELELSLRSEFEGQLKNAWAEMRREAGEFQARVQDELNAQRNRLDQTFSEFTSKFDGNQAAFDEAFRSTVAEHLRLARDEGARITADAMAEAERLAPPPIAAVPEPAKYDLIKDAVDDISSKDSQSAILKSLVQHAGNFAPRGAFFIIKNEHFAGWKTFDADGETDTAIREINFPLSNPTILGAAAASLRASDEPAGGDAAFLSPLEFGQSDQACAIPLVARGKGVAVLYADSGEAGDTVNREALETLVRVAGLTVELLAFSSTAKTDEQPAPAPAESYHEAAPAAFEPPLPATVYQADIEPTPSGFAFGDSTPSYGDVADQPFERSFQSAPAVEPPVDEYKTQSYFEQPMYESPVPAAAPSPFTAPEPTPFSSPDPFRTNAFERPQENTPTHGEMVFDSGNSKDPATLEHESPVKAFEPAGLGTSRTFNKGIEPTPGAVVSPQRRSDRPVDLPIEVPEEERRIHNDARRFARLLVSEIKLYNEKKVQEGRQGHDLYDRLREAIDRSREMYDKRVQPPVAAKFDYFHYELVNSLADGDSVRLGSNYPGSTV